MSPDGTEVFFIKRGTAPAAIWKVSIEGGAAVQISRLSDATTEGFLAISPNGKWLAYRHVSAQPESNGESQTMRVGVLPTDGGAEPRLFDLQISRPVIQWSADSAAFYYVGGAFTFSSLFRQSLTGGKPEN